MSKSFNGTSEYILTDAEVQRMVASTSGSIVRTSPLSVWCATTGTVAQSYLAATLDDPQPDHTVDA